MPTGNSLPQELGRCSNQLVHWYNTGGLVADPVTTFDSSLSTIVVGSPPTPMETLPNSPCPSLLEAEPNSPRTSQPVMGSPNGLQDMHFAGWLPFEPHPDQVCDPQLLNQSKSHPYEPTGTSPYQPEDSPRAPLEVEPMTPPSTDEPPSPAASSSSSEQSDIVPPHPCTRKRGVPCRPNSRRRRRQSNNNSRNPSSSANRRAKVFICSFKRYGCDSTFGSKNEWKRHINSQHIKKSFWRCDLGNCNVSQQQRHPRVPNDFNRKDLFMQHVRRMHAPWGRAAAPSSRKKDQFEKQIILVTNRCHVRLRNPPPKSRCGFCSSTFTNWEMRLEHVGRHYEQGAPGEEAEDPDLRDWALNEGVIRMDHTTGKLTLT